ncbi:nuclear transport factor 2 family protein [Thermopolyspora sp. NPDC052614]|uniref:nuclear transport factor 2 family protein n=1 Tax=Thermopolyspora sp. NPDC052614 TaxID=3155682 RepID=UPI003422F5FA
MDTVDRFRDAAERRDLDAAAALLAPGVRLYSPVKFTPFEGADAVRGLLGVLMRTFEDFRYVGALEGEAEPVMEGTLTAARILIFRAVVGGKQIHGIDLFQLDDQGRIAELTVMVRPLSAVTALGEAVLAGLTADGVIPA